MVLCKRGLTFGSPAFQGWVLLTKQEAFLGVEFPFLEAIIHLNNCLVACTESKRENISPVFYACNQSQQMRQPHSSISNDVHLSRFQREVLTEDTESIFFKMLCGPHHVGAVGLHPLGTRN